jgi:hypothetical protein
LYYVVRDIHGWVDGEVQCVYVSCISCHVD